MTIYPRGDYFITFTGKKFYFSDPLPEMICLADIAHALAHQCRFGGHAKRFYSVAEHSVLVSYLVPPHLALKGLLHAAAKAYYGDIVRPLKQQALIVAQGVCYDSWARTERKCLECIFGKYGLTGMIRHSRVVGVDIKLLGVEYDRLISEVRPPSLLHVSKLDLMGHRIVGYLPEEAEKLFLERAAALGLQE